MAGQSRGAGDREVIPVSLGFVSAFIVRGADRVILVDTGTTGKEKDILSAIEKEGFAPDQVALIAITHAHADHTGSAHALKQATGAKVAVHEKEAPYLVQGKSAEIVPASLLGRVMRLATALRPQAVEAVQPDILIADELDLHDLGIRGRIVSTPGHTAGSVSVLLDSGKCLVGDLLTALTGSPGHPPFIRDRTDLQQSIRKIIDLGAKEIYPSHGGPCGVDRIKKLAE